MSEYVRNFLRFCLLITFQVLVLNKAALTWWAAPNGFPIFIPFVYPLILLLLPFETPVWALLLLGFGTGLTIDAFSNTAGMHTMAMVLIAYLRTNVLVSLVQRPLNDYPNLSPSVKTMNWAPFLTYCAFLLFLHHITFFVIEIWSFKNVGLLLLKTFVSTFTSLLLVIAYSLLFTVQRSAAGTN